MTAPFTRPPHGLKWTVEPNDPAIKPDRVQDPGSPVPLYGADKWNLGPLGTPAAVKTGTLIWTRFPEPLRESFRRAAWLLINTPLPEALLDRDKSKRHRVVQRFLNPHDRNERLAQVRDMVAGEGNYATMRCHPQRFRNLCQTCSSLRNHHCD